MVSVSDNGIRVGHTAEAGQNQLNPLPRSVVRPNDYELLDGEWRFELDLEDRGLHERWFLGHRWQRSAHWPHAIEAYLEGAKDAQRQARSAQSQRDRDESAVLSANPQ